MTTANHAPESKAAGADLSLAFDDLRYTLESYRVSNDERLAEIETRSGVDKPKGFLAYPTVAETSWSWGNIGVLNTGVAGAFAAANPSDILVDLV